MRKRCRPWLPVRSWRSRHVKPVERDELLNFIEQQGFAPDTAKGDIREVFDSRLRQLEDRPHLGYDHTRRTATGRITTFIDTGAHSLRIAMGD